MFQMKFGIAKTKIAITRAILQYLQPEVVLLFPEAKWWKMVHF
jgi:hypothetical protein